MKHALDNNLTQVEVTASAEEDWINTITGFEGGPLGGLGGPDCTPGYYNNEGQPNPLAQQSAPYGGGSIKFFELMQQWRDDGGFEGLSFS